MMVTGPPLRVPWSSLVAMTALAFAACKSPTSNEAYARAEGRLLHAEALRALGDGREDLALLIGVEAERRGLDAGDALDCALRGNGARRGFLHGHGPGVTLGAFSPDGEVLVSVDGGNQLIVWDTSRRMAMERLDASKGLVRTPGWFTPDGMKFAVRVASQEWNVIELRKVGTGLPVDRMFQLVQGAVLVVDSPRPDEDTWLLTCRFDATGSLAAGCASDGSVHLWRVADGRGWRVERPGGGACIDAAFQDGETLATASRLGNVVLWRVEDGQEIASPITDLGRAGGIFSSDGALLASAHGPMERAPDGSERLASSLWVRRVVDGTVHLREFFPPCEARGIHVAVDFSRESRYLVTCDADGHVVRWNLHATPTMSHRVITEPEESPRSMTACPRSDMVALARADGRIVLFDASVTEVPTRCDDWVISTRSPATSRPEASARACAIAGRSLSEDEWRGLFGDEHWRQTCPAK